jgi:hypothetical protein
LATGGFLGSPRTLHRAARRSPEADHADRSRRDQGEDYGGAITLIQRFDPVVNLSIRLHCPVLLQTVITRQMKLLRCRRALVEELGQTYLAEPDAEAAAAPVQTPG